MAASRLVDARSWAAPRLDRAAHSVERDLAPKISAILSDTAKRIDPGPAKSRKWPLMLLIGGITLGIVGAMMYRKNAQRWTDTMKETASDASRWMSEKAERSEETVTEKTDTIGSPSESDVSRRTP